MPVHLKRGCHEFCYFPHISHLYWLLRYEYLKLKLLRKKSLNVIFHFFKTKLVLYLSGTDNQFVQILGGAGNLIVLFFSALKNRTDNQYFLLFSGTANCSPDGLWGRITKLVNRCRYHWNVGKIGCPYQWKIVKVSC